MTRVVKRLLMSPKFAVDEEGNLYRINQHDVAKQLMPKLHHKAGVHGRGNLYYYVQHNGQKIRFCRETLKELQEKAIALVMR